MAANHQTSYENNPDGLTLAGGKCLFMRPVEPSDRDGLAELFERLSPQSRHRRFLTPKPTLAPRELAFFTEVDHVAHEAIVAVDECEDAIVGVARYVRDGGEGVAELAVEVADDMQNRGIGAALVARTIERAGANGFTRLTAMTLWDNVPARRLVRRFGFRPVAAHGTTISFALDLEPRGYSVVADPGRDLPRGVLEHRRQLDDEILHSQPRAVHAEPD